MMKASVKVREAEKPLVRGKLPLNLFGLPFTTGISVGDPEELALHLGSCFEAGPAFRFTYYPNIVENPFAIGIKTGFGLWGSPSGAALAMSAEFNLSSNGKPAFSVRLKPRIGDFSFRKDSRGFLEAASYKGTRSGSRLRESGIGASEVKHLDDSPGFDGGISSPNSSPLGLGLGLGLSVKEKVRTFSNGFMHLSDSPEKGKDSGELVKEMYENAGSHYGIATVDGDGGMKSEDVLHDTSNKSMMQGSGSDTQRSWIEESLKGWSFVAHSALPLGRRAIAKVRWNMKFNSNLFQNLANGTHISDFKLPVLSVEKLSIQSVDPFGRLRSVAPTNDRDEATLCYGLDGTRADDYKQLGRIAGMCSSMRHQLQVLHSENTELKQTLDDLRVEMLPRRSLKQGEMLIQEENNLRSQLYDDLKGKVSSKNQNGSREGSYRKEVPQRSGQQESFKAPAKYPAKPTEAQSATSASTDFSNGGDSGVSEELKKAILSQTGPVRGG